MPGMSFTEHVRSRGRSHFSCRLVLSSGSSLRSAFASLLPCSADSRMSFSVPVLLHSDTVEVYAPERVLRIR